MKLDIIQTILEIKEFHLPQWGTRLQVCNIIPALCDGEASLERGPGEELLIVPINVGDPLTYGLCLCGLFDHLTALPAFFNTLKFRD